MKIEAAVAHSPDQDFEIEQLELDDPRADEVRVRIKAVGICHTDLLAKSQVLPIALPAVFGHEGAGIVDAVGEDIEGIVVGDHVALSFRSCGVCRNCKKPRPSHCAKLAVLNFIGSRPDGTTALSLEGERVSSHFFGQSAFASHVITSKDNLILIDNKVPFEIAAPLGCGGQTGIGAVMNTLDVRAGDSALIIGTGSVGLYAVMAAKLVGCSSIIACDTLASRRDMAGELGATALIDPTLGNLKDQVLNKMPGGVDVVIDTTGRPDVLEEAVFCLGMGGQLAMIGVPNSSEVQMPGKAIEFFNRGASISTVLEGDANPQTIIPMILQKFSEGVLPIDRIVKTYPFREINQAISDQHSGCCIKPVLLME